MQMFWYFAIVASLCFGPKSSAQTIPRNSLVIDNALLLPAFESRLTADVLDVDVEFGLVVNDANTLTRAESPLTPPPGNYTAGTMVSALFRSLEQHSHVQSTTAYEIYTTNSSGNIPVMSSDGVSPNDDDDDDPGMCLYRWTTSDFSITVVVSVYSGCPRVVLVI